jgi:hypothetical protein
MSVQLNKTLFNARLKLILDGWNVRLIICKYYSYNQFESEILHVECRA